MSPEALKEYKRLWAREYRAQNPVKYAAYIREYVRKNGEKYRIRAKRDYDLNREQRCEAARLKRIAEPEAAKARNQIVHAVASGKLIRPTHCSDCNAETKTQAHHHKGYSLEFALDVEWLCTRCHKQRHYKHIEPLAQD